MRSSWPGEDDLFALWWRLEKPLERTVAPLKEARMNFELSEELAFVA